MSTKPQNTSKKATVGSEALTLVVFYVLKLINLPQCQFCCGCAQDAQFIVELVFSDLKVLEDNYHVSSPLHI